MFKDAKHTNFVVGDKVKLCNPLENKRIGNAVGTVVEVGENGRYPIYVQWGVTVCVVCGDKDCGYAVKYKWHELSAIEHAVKKNEQLLFDFMMP